MTDATPEGANPSWVTEWLAYCRAVRAPGQYATMHRDPVSGDPILEVRAEGANSQPAINPARIDSSPDRAAIGAVLTEELDLYELSVYRHIVQGFDDGELASRANTMRAVVDRLAAELVRAREDAARLAMEAMKPLLQGALEEQEARDDRIRSAISALFPEEGTDERYETALTDVWCAVAEALGGAKRPRCVRGEYEYVPADDDAAIDAARAATEPNPTGGDQEPAPHE